MNDLSPWAALVGRLLADIQTTLSLGATVGATDALMNLHDLKVFINSLGK